MALLILRLVFLVVAAGLGVQLINSEAFPSHPSNLPPRILGVVVMLSMVVIFIDFIVKRKRLDVITSVYFGLIIGLFLTYIVKLALTPVLPAQESLVGTYLPMFLGVILCYVCVSVLLQTKDDFRFIIPYVEFSKNSKGQHPLVIDTSVIIDGRIADVMETRAIENQLIMPQFVIAELQNIADSSDKLRRNRGRRGLDILSRLRADKQIDLVIFDRDLPEFADQPVDQKLVLLAKHLDGKVVTNDYNLNKVAKLQNVDVVNLNDIANSLKPIFLPGEAVEVLVVKPGEESHQGIGYLEDGTMVVIESGRSHVGEQIYAEVTSVLQTSAGRMVFARFQREATSA